MTVTVREFSEKAFSTIAPNQDLRETVLLKAGLEVVYLRVLSSMIPLARSFQFKVRTYLRAESLQFFHSPLAL